MSSTKLIDLNDDCLLHIFQYLRTIDVYHLAKLSNRFYHLIAFHWLKNHYCNAVEIASFRGSVVECLTMFGPYIKHLIISLNYFRFLNHSNKLFYSVAEHCSNLKLIIMLIDLYNINQNTINVFAEKLSNLNGIIMKNSHYFSVELPRTLLLNASKLHYLGLDNFGINLINFEKIRFLNELNLANCSVNFDGFKGAIKTIRHSLQYIVWKNSHFTDAINGDAILSSLLCVLNTYTSNLISFSFRNDTWCM